MMAVVIPATRELETLPACIDSISRSADGVTANRSDVHVIVVVNQPAGSDRDTTENNRKTVQWLDRHAASFPFRLHAIDRTDPGLSNGVGEARRIGMDYAAKELLKRPSDLIVSLDADCVVRADYLRFLTRQELTGGGFTLPFEHDLERAEEPEKIALYELHLRYMRKMLAKAGSPFSFFTVGSCLGTDVANYVAAGGMPERPATEDFHFLNKLRKRGIIEAWTGTCVYPSSRHSNRVFLGTGHYMANSPELFLPPPESFDLLRSVVNALNDYFFAPDASVSRLNSIELLRRFMEEQKIPPKLARLRSNSRSAKTYELKVIQLFDGLMTYRLLRTISLARTPPTLELFLSWVNSAYAIRASDLIGSLHEARRIDLKPPG